MIEQALSTFRRLLSLPRWLKLLSHRNNFNSTITNKHHMESSEAGSGKDFTEMSDDEFFEHIRGEIAEAAGITPGEVHEMCPSDIERRIEEEQDEPLEWRTPEPGSRYYSPLLDKDPITRKEYQRREERVEAFLDPNQSARWLRWKYRKEDTYDALSSVAREGMYFLEETVEFAKDIGRALSRED
ncbi:MAG: hypothetical protein SVV03_04830 [Candidatus Nanohaloarchaea archaeon]|nr:hypothetical protein [Candidatus Nanohaloarchaea archaeon]